MPMAEIRGPEALSRLVFMSGPIKGKNRGCPEKIIHEARPACPIPSPESVSTAHNNRILLEITPADKGHCRDVGFKRQSFDSGNLVPGGKTVVPRHAPHLDWW